MCAVHMWIATHACRQQMNHKQFFDVARVEQYFEITNKVPQHAILARLWCLHLLLALVQSGMYSQLSMLCIPSSAGVASRGDVVSV